MPTPTQIVILEDNAERRVLMRGVLEDRFPQYESRFFQTSGETIAHLRDELELAVLIVLDHDLEMIPIDKHRMIDPGDGRDVADFLATRSAVCPIVIHSTNSPAAVGMIAVLEESNWTVHRVIPVGEFRWIRSLWRQAVCDAIVPAGATASAKPTS